MLKFALAGNPNSGKTTLFNALTGSTAHVGNWPGVTVDKREGVYKKCAEPISIVDLPGIYSLSPYTPEEVISRNFLLDEKPDCIINIVDATNLERNLYLTTQLMEIDIPVAVALNMMDEVEKNGDSIDVAALEERLGLPVVAVSALREKGLDELMSRAYDSSKTPRKGKTVLSESPLRHLIGDCEIALRGQGIDNALFHAIKLVESDELEVKSHPASNAMVEEFRKTFNDETFGGDIEALIADGRYKYITGRYSPTLTRHAPFGGDKANLTRSDKIDRVLTHKLWSIPIFLIILFAIFHLTFSEDLLYLGAAGVFGEADGETEAAVTAETESEGEIAGFLSGVTVNTIFGYEEGVYSPGVVLFNVMETFTGLLDACARQGLQALSAPEWVVGLLADGILGGVFAVLGFLPQILLLFFFFSLLEDSGYMARAAFILDRIFRKFGLSGRAFMPMIMGFGCSVPAMINTRTLADQRERTATVRVIPFFSCGAKLPILTAIAGGIVQMTGFGNGDLITYGMYLLGIITAIVSVILMRNTTMKGDTPPFIMELPSYRMPGFRNLMLHLWDKAKHFIKKAFTVILASTVVIWLISHFSPFWEFLPDSRMNESILAGFGGLIQPLFTPMGFGSQLGGYGWVFAVAALTGLLAKENVIATFGTLGACIAGAALDVETDGGVSAVVQMISSTGIGVPGLLAFIAFNMTTIPCFAAIATAKAELPSKSSYRNTLLFWIATSYVVASMVYLIGLRWWTVFIFLGVWAAVIAVIVLNNKGKIHVKLPVKNKKAPKKSACAGGCSECPYCCGSKTEKHKNHCD